MGRSTAFFTNLDQTPTNTRRTDEDDDRNSHAVHRLTWQRRKQRPSNQVRHYSHTTRKELFPILGAMVVGVVGYVVYRKMNGEAITPDDAHDLQRAYQKMEEERQLKSKQTTASPPKQYSDGDNAVTNTSNVPDDADDSTSNTNNRNGKQ